MQFFENYKFCPFCGHEYEREDWQEDIKMFRCANCHRTFYQNMTPTVCAVIPKFSEPMKLLLTTRAQGPHQGKIDLPGGFFRYGEDFRHAITREIKEELGVEVHVVEIIDILINDYIYEGLNYKHVTPYCLTEPLKELPEIADKKENTSCDFYDIREIDKWKEKIAFRPEENFMRKYLENLG